MLLIASKSVLRILKVPLRNLLLNQQLHERNPHPSSATFSCLMTEQDLDIILEYLQKATVPAADHDAFFRAFERLRAIRYKEKQAA
jgi:hypothetical protein